MLINGIAVTKKMAKAISARAAKEDNGHHKDESERLGIVMFEKTFLEATLGVVFIRIAQAELVHTFEPCDWVFLSKAFVKELVVLLASEGDDERPAGSG